MSETLVTTTRDLSKLPTSVEASQAMASDQTLNNAREDVARLQRLESRPSPYYSLPLWRKSLIVFSTSFTALAVTFSSTSLFIATSEISKSLDTDQSTIQVINAVVLVAMGCSGFLWGPLARIYGRKYAWLGAGCVFILCTVGTGLAPESTGLAVFAAMRILSGLEGCCFHTMGQTWLADVFEPTQRGTATGFFLLGTVFGPAFGPCAGGIILTFASWRVILWLQAAMMATGMLLSIAFLPDIRTPEVQPQFSTKKERFIEGLKKFNPSYVFKLMAYPDVLLTNISCAFLSWSQYTLLAAPRHVLNPRFNLTTPLVSGLFYIAPGAGFLAGTVIGGRFSDMTVKKWIRIRGMRLPQDRLKSGMISFFFTIPASSLIYGWGLHFEVGGLALPIVTAFFCGFGLLMAFASLNTYCAECRPRQRGDVIASKYLVQYASSAIGSASIVPLIDSIGMGPATTIGVALVLLAGVLTLITATFGSRMANWVDDRRLARSEKAIS